MEEKRKYPRFDMEAKVQFQKVKDVENLKEGLVKDISAEGFCFGCDERLAIGDVLKLEVLEKRMPDMPLYVRCEVVWTKDNPELKDNQDVPKYLTGVKILGIRDTDEARFTMFYCERVISELKRYYHL